MSLWPRSLVARFTWLVAAVGILSLALHMLVMSWLVQSMLGDVSHAIAGRVLLARQQLERAPPAERDTVARSLTQGRFELARLERLEIEDDSAVAPIAGRVLISLRQELGPDFRVRLPGPRNREEPGELRLDFVHDNEAWRFTYRLQPPVLAVLGTGLGWLLLVALAVSASLVLGALFIARPIAVLAQRLRDSGPRLSPLPPPKGGASELVALTLSFNRLAEAAQQADVDRQHLLAGVSHDLRTPLARLRLRIETQVDETQGDKLLADVDAIERIVAQFLAYVQGELNMPSAPTPHDAVQDVLRQVVSSYAAQGQDVQALPSDVVAQLPDLALQRVLHNLIDNALAHGRSPVRVSLSRQGEHAVLCVSDHGKGMSAAEFEKACQPFVRLEGSNTALGHCGLGLAIVSQLARQLGARLERQVDSAGRFGVVLVWPLASAIRSARTNPA
jgi:two-component system, OmpR family, osmolarity sensor histidine kinase EnvZ